VQNCRYSFTGLAFEEPDHSQGGQYNSQEREDQVKNYLGLKMYFIGNYIMDIVNKGFEQHTCQTGSATNEDTGE
jgi:hypothetical protein